MFGASPKVRSGFGSFMANAWARSFLAHLTTEMKGIVLYPAIALDRIRKDAETIFWEREHTLPDKQSKTLNASCCVVLAAFREIQSQRSSSQSFDLVRRAVYRTYQKPMRFLARLWLSLTRDPLKRLGGNWWKKQSQRMYGAGMQFDQEETADSVDLLVRRCAFHQFFVEHGEPELTRVFCGWDRNWMDIVDEPGRSIRTERLTTISTGGDCCRFRIVRVTGDNSRDVRDIVVQSPAVGKE
jgi:hypothetical protein